MWRKFCCDDLSFGWTMDGRGMRVIGAFILGAGGDYATSPCVFIHIIGGARGALYFHVPVRFG